MQLAIADLFDVSQPTVRRVVHRFSEALASLLPDFIHLPVNRDECKTVGREDAERFRCQKNYFALNVQTIVDSDLVIPERCCKMARICS
ncbi:nuclease HARBI1 [Trichonephila clavipes]|nr:nuclease HARBI1 [Trichonephila clavipes]